MVLVKVDEQQKVSGRELHEFLEVATQYKDWFPRMCEYGFTESVDFNSLKNEQVQIEGSREVTRTITDHLMTLSMAKEICMLQRSEKGKQARQYFIECEQKLRNQKTLPTTYLDALKELVASETERIALLEQNTVMQPKAEYFDKVLQSDSLYTVTQIAKDLGMSAVTLNKNLQKLGVQFKVGGQWVLKAAHQDKGYTDTVTTLVQHTDSVQTHLATKWTEKGRKFIIDTLDKLI